LVILIYFDKVKHIDELLEELGPDEPDAEDAVEAEDEESWETDEEDMDQN
jgi:hypothetical protein